MKVRFKPTIDMKQVLEDVRRDSNDIDGPRPCICCGAIWTPESWNFHGLCDDCFREWDGQRPWEEDDSGYESVEEWMEARK